jgi:foldase protein PrsA
MPIGKKVIRVEEKKTETVSSVKTSRRFLSLKNIILLIILVIAVLFWKFKGYFVVALVNGQPISRWQLSDQLMKKYGSQTLDNIINERLILAAARQKGIFVKADEIDARVKQIEGRIAGQISLDDALKAQGLSQDEFRRQLEIQISIEKLFTTEATVSASEIDEYLGKNKTLYKDATDTALLREEVKDTISKQKLSDAFDKWFTDIQKSAKINKFL